MLKKVFKKIGIGLSSLILFFLMFAVFLSGGPTSNNNLRDGGYFGSSNITEREDSYYANGTPLNDLLWSKVFKNGNPFPQFPGNYDGRQCTAFAWYRFYQEYKFDSGARGDGKDNAREITLSHPDRFVLSKTPAPSAVFSSFRLNAEDPNGHVGFIEKYDGKFIWISHGNVNRHGIFINQKWKFSDFQDHYCKWGCEFAISKKGG